MFKELLQMIFSFVGYIIIMAVPIVLIWIFFVYLYKEDMLGYYNVIYPYNTLKENNKKAWISTIKFYGAIVAIFSLVCYAFS